MFTLPSSSGPSVVAPLLVIRRWLPQQVWTASVHLDGAAAEWYFQLERDHGLSWARFGEYLNLRFGPPIRSNSLGELKELKRTASVEEYQRRFLALLCRCENLTAQHQIDLFTAGLGQPLSSDVELQRPTTLQTAMSLARAYERWSLTMYSKQHFCSKPLVAAGGTAAPPPARETAKTDTAKPRFRRLSLEEIAEKRAIRQCYFCPEKFSKDHNCATKGVFFLSLDEEDDSEPTEEDIGISLTALTGINIDDTLRLTVVINGMTLQALVDTGSTHTFVHEELTRKLVLHISQWPGLSVKVAIGDRVVSPGVCQNTTVQIEQDSFEIDCFALCLDGFDLFLGVKWLKTLGPVSFDFKGMWMAFW